MGWLGHIIKMKGLVKGKVQEMFGTKGWDWQQIQEAVIDQW